MLAVVFIVLAIVCIVQFNKNDELTQKIRKLEKENELLRKKMAINSKDNLDELSTKNSSENNAFENNNIDQNKNVEKNKEVEKNEGGFGQLFYKNI